MNPKRRRFRRSAEEQRAHVTICGAGNSRGPRAMAPAEIALLTDGGVRDEYATLVNRVNRGA